MKWRLNSYSVYQTLLILGQICCSYLKTYLDVRFLNRSVHLDCRISTVLCCVAVRTTQSIFSLLHPWEDGGRWHQRVGTCRLVYWRDVVSWWRQHSRYKGMSLSCCCCPERRRRDGSSWRRRRRWTVMECSCGSRCGARDISSVGDSDGGGCQRRPVWQMRRSVVLL